MVNLEQTDWGKEDINYFERASQSGFQILLDPTMVVQKLKQFNYRPLSLLRFPSFNVIEIGNSYLDNVRGGEPQ